MGASRRRRRRQQRGALEQQRRDAHPLTHQLHVDGVLLVADPFLGTSRAQSKRNVLVVGVTVLLLREWDRIESSIEVKHKSTHS